MDILNVRHSWPEPAGFEIDRPRGGGDYIFLHFQSATELFFNGQWHNAPPGTLIVFEPDAPHRFISRCPLVHDWMHLSGDVRGELAGFGVRTNVMYAIADGRPITERVARLESEVFAHENHWERFAQAVLDELWILISRQTDGRAAHPIPPETERRLQALRAEMILHPEWTWTNAMMAQRVNVSESRLYPLYRRLFAIQPGRDLILMRVEKARQLLAQGMPVARTAEQLGYGSVYHFIRQFRQVAGVTPGRWMDFIRDRRT